MKKKVTVTIVCYRNYKDVEKTINSIEKNTDVSLSKQIFIVDNSNFSEFDSKTNDFLLFIRKFKDVSYINSRSNIGFGKGHNLAIPKLNSEYHAIVNPDIVLKGDALGKIIHYMDNHLDVGMGIPKIINNSNNIQMAYRKELTVFDMFIRVFCPKLFPKRMKNHTLQEMDYSKPFNVPFGQGSFLVIRTRIFKDLHGFDDNFFMYLEDADLCKRVNTISKLVYIPNSVVIHKWEKGSHKNLKLMNIHIKSMIYYFNKWGWKLF